MENPSLFDFRSLYFSYEKNDLYNLKIQTGFTFSKGYSAKNDVICDLFIAVANSIEYEIVKGDGDYVIVSNFGFSGSLLMFQIDVIRKAFEKHGFHVVWGEKKNNSVEPLVKDSVSPKVDRKNPKVLSFLVSELKSYVQNGQPVKIQERVVSFLPETRIELVLSKFFKGLSTKGLGRSFAVPLKEFSSEVEKVNKFLVRLNDSFKGEERLDFLTKRRTEDLMKIHKELFTSNFEVGTLIDGWLIVDSARIYNYLYKFGSRNRKMYIEGERFVILKPSKLDFVVFLDKVMLSQLDDKQTIEIVIRSLPNTVSVT